VDDWDEMTTEEKKRFIAIVFDEIQADTPGITTLIARGRWKDYIEAVVSPSGIPVLEVRVPTERKTGVKRAEVITARLVQDDRGWLKLAS
jgi:hypothetical protein